MWGEGKGLGERQGPVIPRPSVMGRLDDPDKAPRDFAVVAASHPMKGFLDPGVPSVVTGTPVKPTRTGWVICPPDQAPIAFAGNHHSGGDSFVAYRSMTVETYNRRYWPGDRYNISQVDDRGHVTFEPQESGPYVGLSESQLLLDARNWRAPSAPEASPPLADPPEAAPVPMPQLASLEEEYRPDDTYTLPEDMEDEVSPLREADDEGPEVPVVRKEVLG